MCNFYSQFADFFAPKGLHCVWVRSGDCGGAPLVARWIVPRIAENQSPVENKNSQACREICIDQEEPAAELGPALCFAFAGAV